MKFHPFALLMVLISAPSAAAPTPVIPPEEYFGHRIGADRRLADWDRMTAYFDLLGRASNRVRVDTLGTSTRGRPLIMAIISSSSNLRRIEELRGLLGRLADPRKVPPDSVGVLIASARPAVLIGCAQHASEIGSTQMSVELAYRLAVATDPELVRALNGVILLLIPSLNPDGHQMVTEWYRSVLGTPYEGGGMPWLYHPYVGHDINRDWFMLTQVETRLVSDVMYRRWFPQVVLDMHQMDQTGARLFVPPPADPVNPNYDPLLNRLIALVGAELGLAHTRAGQTGVISHALYDAWWPGYLSAVPYAHNAVSLISEAASCNVASPVFLRRDELRGGRPGMDLYDVLTNFPDPWPGGWWRLRDIVDYELVLTETLLKHVAAERELYLSLFHDLGRRQVELGASRPPYAFILPRSQEDSPRAWELARTLSAGGIEVYRAEAPFSADGIEYGSGSLVIPMAQPYRAYAKDLLEIQRYPDRRRYPDGPPERPYDSAGWSMPLAMDVDAVQAIERFEFEGRLITGSDGPESGIEDGRSGAYMIDGRANNSQRLVNRALAGRLRVRKIDGPAVAVDGGFPRGGFVIEPGKAAGAFESWLNELGLTAQGVTEAEASGSAEVRPVRLGVYQPWTASMDEGWLRWVLERFEFPYKTLHNGQLRAGRLKDRFDVIVLPDMSPGSIEDGVPEGELPPEYVGGLGREGGFALRDFVRSGGTLMAVNRACDWAIDWFDLPVKNILDRAEPPGEEKEQEFFCPGSLLRLELDRKKGHPLLFGLGESVPIFYQEGPVFSLEEEDEAESGEVESGGVDMLGSYPASNPLLSGWIQNPEIIAGGGALACLEVGRGRLVLFGFTPYRRAQTQGTFRFLFNAIRLGSRQ